MKKYYGVLIATLVSLTGIYLVNAGKTPLKPTGEVGWQEDTINYTQPPGFIFSIWGLIYLGFLAYALYAVLAKQRDEQLIYRTSRLVTVSIVLNLVWVVLAGAQWLIAAYVLQWIMLVLSILLLFQFRLAEAPLSAERKWLSAPFGLYAGWLTVAMIPFTADLLNHTGWRGEPLSQPVWGCILYGIAVLLVVWAYQRLRQPFYLLPLAWALYGFSVRFDEAYVVYTAAGLCVLLTVYAVIRLVRFYRSRGA